MFTGIITDLGKIKEKTKDSLVTTVEKDFSAKLSIGLSISIDGICLTVIDFGSNFFKIDFMKETEDKTNIKYLNVGDLVNLELPATPTSFLSGHIVQGHVDGIGKIEDLRLKINDRILEIIIQKSLSKYIVDKGSITVNGISLTVIDAGSDFFTVSIIPHTFENTMLKNIKEGDFVNIEVDILGKYLERLMRK